MLTDYAGFDAATLNHMWGLFLAACDDSDVERMIRLAKPLTAVNENTGRATLVDAIGFTVAMLMHAKRGGRIAFIDPPAEDRA